MELTTLCIFLFASVVLREVIRKSLIYIFATAPESAYHTRKCVPHLKVRTAPDGVRLRVRLIYSGKKPESSYGRTGVLNTSEHGSSEAGNSGNSRKISDKQKKSADPYLRGLRSCAEALFQHGS